MWALVNNLRFADDIGLLTRSEPELQDITTQIDETSRKFGPMINAEKTKTMAIEKRKDTSKYQHPRRKYRAGRTVCLPIKCRWQPRKRHTKKNWTHVTSIWNDESLMTKIIYGKAKN